jgi:DNA (cytosine-5)-methyltransferase 1
MLTSRGLGRVLGDLAAMGFDARWGVLGAADVGAPHQRDRIWIVAKWRGHLSHAQHDRIRWWEQQQESLETTHREMADPDFIGLDESKTKRDRTQEQQVCQNELDYGNEIWSEAIGCGQLGNEKELANSAGIGLEGQGQSEQPINSKTYRDWETSQSANVRESDFWATEPNVGRVVNGMASRVDRIKALGNGQVPLCAATAWRILK